MANWLSMVPALTSLASTAYTNISQKKRAREQVEAQKELNSHAMGLQHGMWKDTNFSAQVEEMKKAGVNPGLVYGMNGAGGATTGSVGAGGASKADTQAIDLQSIASLGLMKAQKELIEAQTEKTEAEAQKTAGVDTEATKAGTELTNIQTELAKLQARIGNATEQESINIIRDTSDKLLAEAVKAQHDQIISEKTLDERVQQIKSESIGAMIENELKRSNINVNKARVHQISEQLVQTWENIRLQDKGIEASLENMRKMTEAMLWSAGINATGNLTGGIINMATKNIEKAVNTTTKTKGVNKK